jgi:hypothetical protein
MWHIDTWLGNDRERKEKTVIVGQQLRECANITGAVARQQPSRNNKSTVGNNTFCGSAQ